MTTTTKEERRTWLELAAKATPGPWRAMRDGNQYVGTTYMPTAKCVGASRLEGPPRPWNPHAHVAFGTTALVNETNRCLDDDADFIAVTREAVPRLILDVEALNERLAEANMLLRTALHVIEEEFGEGSVSVVALKEFLG